MKPDFRSQNLGGIQNAHVERYYEVEILSSDRINLRIRIRFANGCLLEMNEAVIVEKCNCLVQVMRSR